MAIKRASQLNHQATNFKTKQRDLLPYAPHALNHVTAKGYFGG